MLVDRERPVPRDLVDELCALAAWAPNHKRTWPWRFAIAEGEGRARLGETGEPVSPAELQLRHALGPRLRRWVAAEWVYSAVDRPWFLRNEFAALLG